MRKALKETHKSKGYVPCIENDGTMGTKLSNRELKRRKTKRQMATTSKRGNRKTSGMNQRQKASMRNP